MQFLATVFATLLYVKGRWSANISSQVTTGIIPVRDQHSMLTLICNLM